MKFKETRFITMEDLRRLCIREEWYTLGDNAEYSRMLNKCWDDNNYRYAELTVELIECIARDIQYHSDVPQDDEFTATIMFEIAEMSTTCYEVIKEGDAE